MEEALPPPPVLNVLPPKGPDRKQLQMPEHLVKKYATDPQFMDQFAQLLNKFVEEFGFAEETPSADQQSKRSAEGQHSGQPANKKRKTAPVCSTMIVEAAAIIGQKLFDIPLISFKNTDGQCRLNVRMGLNAFIANMSGNDIDIKTGMFFVGFGRMEFRCLRMEPQRYEDKYQEH